MTHTDITVTEGDTTRIVVPLEDADSGEWLLQSDFDKVDSAQYAIFRGEEALLDTDAGDGSVEFKKAGDIVGRKTAEMITELKNASVPTDAMVVVAEFTADETSELSGRRLTHECQVSADGDDRTVLIGGVDLINSGT